MSKTNFVIELGSSNTVIYKIGYGIVLREPSVVAIKNGRNEAFEVGAKAKRMLGKTDSSYHISYPIKNGIIEDEKSAEIMLRSFLDKVRDGNILAKINAVFCVSTGLSDNELLAFKNIAYGAGISRVDFINVCLAGLVGAGVMVENATATACVNLGGGSCNFVVAGLNEVIEGFSVAFGGLDMDKSIQEYIYNTKNLEISLQMAEKIKNECGSLYLQDTTNMEISGIDSQTKKPFTEIISATDVRLAIEHFFEKIHAGIEHVLYSCTADVISDVSSNGIYIIGGVANMVGLENYLSKKLNLKVNIPEIPENCTVMGAGTFIKSKNI